MRSPCGAHEMKLLFYLFFSSIFFISLHVKCLEKTAIPFPCEFRRNECQFRLNKIENRQRATQLCQKDNQFCMNEIHFCRSETQFHAKNRLANLAKVFFGKIQFHYGENFFTKAKLKFVHAILILILAKFNFILAKLTRKRYSLIYAILMFGKSCSELISNRTYRAE